MPKENSGLQVLTEGELKLDEWKLEVRNSGRSNLGTLAFGTGDEEMKTGNAETLEAETWEGRQLAAGKGKLVKREAWDAGSCGCLQKQIHSDRLTCLNRTHGMTNTPAWVSWKSMRDRCRNPNAPKFNHYGGRGIKVCPQWESFLVFLEDMGERPVNTTLDRVDVNGMYEPSNCRWATHKEQRENRRH